MKMRLCIQTILALVLIVGEALYSSHVTAQEKRPDEIFRSASPSVVMIIALDEHGQALALGSGFFIDRSGTMATNYHVVMGAKSVKVKLIGKDALSNVEGFYAWDANRDLAIMKVGIANSTMLELSTTKPTIGQKVFAIGNPMGLEGTLSEGIVSGIRRIEDIEFYQITSPISPGSSGGPVLTADGKVIGVATATLAEGQNLNFAVPSHYIDALHKSGKELKPISVAVNEKPSKKLITGSTELVKFLNPYIDLSYLTASVHNGNEYGIKNIRALAIYWVRSSKVPVHFTPILIQKTIPPGLSLAFKVSDDMLFLHGHDWATEQSRQVSSAGKERWDVTFRILDYEIVSHEETLLEFQIGK